MCLSTDDLRGDVMVPPAKKLEDLIHLAELCVDLLQQNEEHYAEVMYQSSIFLSLPHSFTGLLLELLHYDYYFYLLRPHDYVDTIGGYAT